MRLGVLFSGGKDSTLALQYAAEKEEVACLITIVSENKESYMFHTPNIDVTTLQAEALGLPQITKTTARRKRRRTFGFRKCNRPSNKRIPDRRCSNGRNRISLPSGKSSTHMPSAWTLVL